MALLRVNVGCGATPTPGWVNFDNSQTVRLANLPIPPELIERLPHLDAAQRKFLRVAKEQRIQWANVSSCIPLPDGSAEAIYTSHMVEHLDQEEAIRFLAEVRRVLTTGGILRVAVPDLSRVVEEYRATGNANLLVERTLLAHRKPRGLMGMVKFAIVGNREHHWMYDGASLSNLLLANGFSPAKVMAAGTTSIPQPGSLDLHERAEESVYVEGCRV